ncbi:MAG: IclR family transcriptional regulator [Armatimonadota bacterium]|nr:IclR family transcriptional regulator [Armatimonadota bacterium]MDR7448754.1 IclR family transcriptional regulator [Armatimonadota bacterium]MDR7479674.1 IclR family transcriptional regulator [Armatimonadota bacterium]MDR7487811.1 IclR family transcriptional regulator [Armatimonadota bacterium]MDR7490843.1 IclR family transcriptional regulator [Armatimonadota bacterium]
MRNGHPAPRLNGARALEKGVRLLLLLASRDGPQPLSALALRGGLPPSTAHRLLATLVRLGVVEQEPETRRYRIGPRTVAFAADVLQQTDLTREAAPVLHAYVRETGEAISLATLQEGEVVLLEQVRGVDAPRLFLHIGRRAPLHSTALGKVLAAGLPDEEVRRLLGQRGMARLTPRTITSPRRFLEHLAEVRHLGYALDDEETVQGARCLAVPVRDHRGRVVAALSSSGSTGAWSAGHMAAVREALVRAGSRLSARLGYRPDGVAAAGARVPAGPPGPGREGR